MFLHGRQALMKGDNFTRTDPESGRNYALIFDVAGQDEARTTGEEFLQTFGWDSTNLKIVESDMNTVSIFGTPAYRVVFRKEWTCEKHVPVFDALRALTQTRRPMRIIIDTTGVGEGFWFLKDNALGP
jgi:hypothetical protein